MARYHGICLDGPMVGQKTTQVEPYFRAADESTLSLGVDAYFAKYRVATYRHVAGEWDGAPIGFWVCGVDGDLTSCMRKLLEGFTAGKKLEQRARKEGWL